ncbi:hypothetical protein CRE_08104 [Caenorhabditis remanei]|uniref:Uncharacterized protein n=1 Tax=Caenorhabditis remanei TaxID=31234 RepID=E3M3F3_CAERE|nr:hypothetical protein CRE_08104 [Caenorhabditis remanei]
MPRHQELDFCFFKIFLLILIDPIWFAVNSTLYSTHISSFLLAHQAFWHCLILTIIPFPMIFPPKNPEARTEDLYWVFLAFFVLYPTIFSNSDVILDYIKMKVQRISHIYFGLFGMILSVWMMIGCVVSWEFDFYRTISGCIFMFCICSLTFFYLVFSNFGNDYYISLPSASQPFSGIKLYVVTFGLFHLMVGIAVINLTGAWPICLLLLASSFVFCSDAYSCLFTETYIFYDHRPLMIDDVENNSDNEIVCYVVVRRMYEKMKNPEDLPKIFKFDDEVEDYLYLKA